MFGDLSFSHILILLLVLVLVFGAKRIPEIGSSLGQGIKEFKRSLKDATKRRPAQRAPAAVCSRPPRRAPSPRATRSVLSGLALARRWSEQLAAPIHDLGIGAQRLKRTAVTAPARPAAAATRAAGPAA